MKRFFIISLIVIISMTAYYKLTYPTFTYKYRMTVEVETPEGIKSGSSVIEVRTKQWPEWLKGLSGGFATNRDAIGEAIVVDLGGRGLLFAVAQRSIGKGGVYPYVFDGDSRYRFESGGVPEYAKAKDFKAQVPKELYPLLVRFRDISDPTTVVEVDPDNLAISFGAGVKLKAITVEATTDPIEWKMEGILPWLSDYYRGLLNREKVFSKDLEYSEADLLGSESFSKSAYH